MEENLKEENPNFRLKAVAELLDGNHHFMIPSYQRGYRWDKKQVEDLLKDICDFAKDAKKGDFYCLQPIVVRAESWIDKNNELINGWGVIDGQQRLTSILLLLKYLRANSEDAKNSPAVFFDIYYKTRPDLDFDNPKKQEDIDSFHAFITKKTIVEWFQKSTIKKSKVIEVLFDDYREENKEKPMNEWEPQVKVIWYVAENENDIESIKIFNNLNKGKIRLTNAELIKALFILKARKEDLKFNQNELAYEWNEMENALHDDKLWYFLANKNYKPATRIDIVFDFLTGKEDKDNSDFSYRKFQNLYDNTNDQFWKDLEVKNFGDAWSKVKEVFQTFIYWFEDGTLYHYIGYLIYWKVPLKDIYTVCVGKSKTQTESGIKKLISDRLLNYKIVDIDEFSYSDKTEKEAIKKLLLFFNIETCVKQQKNQNNEISKLLTRDALTYYKFPFDLCKLYDWDIEHVGSKTDNPLKEVRDKIVWLSYLENFDYSDDLWDGLRKESAELKSKLVERNNDEGNKFEALYKKIVEVVQKDDVDKNEKQNNGKDTIENLALLDAGTNRGYGNALFATKRKIIIEKDKDGIFIPVCTKNLFLKYYTNDDKVSSQWKNSWSDQDRKPYLNAIHDTIDFILK